MSALLSARDLAGVAVEIERDGEAFFKAAAERTRADQARARYHFLAGQERQHRHTFEKLGESLPPEPLPESYSAERDSYIRVLAANRIFSDEASARELARQAGSDREVIDLALDYEQNSLLFYWEMREVTRRTDQAVVDRIMAEEREHIRQLHDLKEDIVN